MNGALHYRHPVISTDTVKGLSLKYGVKIPDLKRTNRIWSNDDIYSRQFLLVPWDDLNKAVPERTDIEEAILHRELVSRFRVKWSTSKEEAIYYLEEHNWNFEVASCERAKEMIYDEIPRPSS